MRTPRNHPYCVGKSDTCDNEARYFIGRDEQLDLVLVYCALCDMLESQGRGERVLDRLARLGLDPSRTYQVEREAPNGTVLTYHGLTAEQVAMLHGELKNGRLPSYAMIVEGPAATVSSLLRALQQLPSALPVRVGSRVGGPATGNFVLSPSKTGDALDIVGQGDLSVQNAVDEEEFGKGYDQAVEEILRHLRIEPMLQGDEDQFLRRVIGSIKKIFRGNS